MQKHKEKVHIVSLQKSINTLPTGPMSARIPFEFTQLSFCLFLWDASNMETGAIFVKTTKVLNKKSPFTRRFMFSMLLTSVKRNLANFGRLCRLNFSQVVNFNNVVSKVSQVIMKNCQRLPPVGFDTTISGLSLQYPTKGRLFIS